MRSNHTEANLWAHFIVFEEGVNTKLKDKNAYAFCLSYTTGYDKHKLFSLNHLSFWQKQNLFIVQRISLTRGQRSRVHLSSCILVIVAGKIQNSFSLTNLKHYNICVLSKLALLVFLLQ